MKMKFYKYQGAGNDFVLLDNREQLFDHSRSDVLANLCNRRFGIGGDGIMFLQNKAGFDFEMIYYNSNGQPSSMCGNGGRCIVAFAKALKICDAETTFLAVDGSHYAKISETGDWVSLQMIDVESITSDQEAYVLNTGSPHYVKQVSALQDADLYNIGKLVRYNETYKNDGINVNLVEDFGDYLFVRTYERGVEDETFACGTGVTAVAMAMAKHKNLTGHIETPIKVLGGELSIQFDYDGKRFANVFLEGPAKFVFEGTIGQEL